MTETGMLVVTFRYDEQLKNQVKAIRGARWNPTERNWYFTGPAAASAAPALQALGFDMVGRPVSVGLDSSGGAPSSASGADSRSAPASTPDRAADGATGQPGDLTVDRLQHRIRSLLEGHFDTPLWVVGYLQNVRDRGERSFMYLEMVDSVQTQTPVSVTVMLSGTYRFRIQAQLRSADLEFQDGLPVRFQVRVTLNRRQQVQLQVLDMDTRHSLGDLALRRTEILARLEREGIRHRNQSLPMPLAPLRVALVTASGSEAAADVLGCFAESAFGFRIELFDVRVQGAALAGTVTRALGLIASRSDEFDVCIIARGGGSRVELSAWDDWEVARAVALLPVKVVVGIGHQRDESVLDLIALRARTPTAAAETCIQAVAEAWHFTREQGELLGRVSRLRLERHRAGLQQRGRAFARSVSRRVESERARTANAPGRLLRAWQHRLTAAERLLSARLGQLRRAPHAPSLQRASLTMQRASAVFRRSERAILPEPQRLDRLANALNVSVRGRLVVERERLVEASHELALADPKRVLARGFAIVRGSAGEALAGVAELVQGVDVVVEMRDGSAKANIRTVYRSADTRMSARDDEEET